MLTVVKKRTLYDIVSQAAASLPRQSAMKGKQTKLQTQNSNKMNSMKNSVTLIGRPGSEPEVKTMNTQKLARFNLAVNESYTNANKERVDDTQWFTIIAWNKNAERVQKLVRKGKQVAIEGRLHNNEWQDKNGAKHVSTEVYLEDLFIIEWDEKKEN